MLWMQADIYARRGASVEFAGSVLDTMRGRIGHAGTQQAGCSELQRVFQGDTHPLMLAFVRKLCWVNILDALKAHPCKPEANAASMCRCNADAAGHGGPSPRLAVAHCRCWRGGSGAHCYEPCRVRRALQREGRLPRLHGLEEGRKVAPAALRRQRGQQRLGGAGRPPIL